MSYQSLEDLLGLEKKLPLTENWSAAADFLQLISEYCLLNKPQVIVECSSGTSSLVLAQCCHMNRLGHVYSLENGDEFLDQTRRQLEEFLLSDYCDVIHAPLRDIPLGDKTFQWYDSGGLPEEKVDMLVIDGPPGFIQKHSRYPALPLLGDKLAEHCIIFLDDAARDDELELVELWQKEHPEFSYEYIDNERGCSILKR
jgi:predicted O-methyltransferase YrrM